MNAAPDHTPLAHGERACGPADPASCATASSRGGAGETSPGARSDAGAARAAEARRLHAIRGQLDALGAAEWQLGADGGAPEGAGLSNMLVDTALEGDRVLLCRFGPHATSDEMQFVADAKTNVGFLLSLVDRAIASLRAHGARACGPASARAADDGRAPVGASPSAEGWQTAEGRKGDRPSGRMARPAGAAGGEAPGAPREAENQPNYAAEAAIKCGEPAFRVFLEERHGLERPLTDDKVAARLRSLLGVTSRRDLNSDEQAAARWKDIRREFDAWRKGR